MKFPSRVDTKTILLLVTMYGLWAVNFWLYAHHPWPLVFHIAVATISIHLSFTIWHEAVHDNVSDCLWFNNVIGVAGIFPYMLNPYFRNKWIHLQHHAKLNQTDDPNFIYVDGPFWQIFFRYFRLIPYARKLMRQDPLAPSEKSIDQVFYGVIAAAYLWAWSHGRFLDLIWLWLVPVLIAKVIMDWYINYLPHVGLPADFHRGTRIVDIPWLTPLVLAHNYHAIHHLWTYLPWHRYTRVFQERMDKVKEYGVPIEKRFFRYPGKRIQVPQPV